MERTSSWREAPIPRQGHGPAATGRNPQWIEARIIDDFVYSMSDELLKVNALGNLGTDLVSLPLLP